MSWVIVVDDCSTDGARQILETMAARQANSEKFAQAQDGSEPIELQDLRLGGCPRVTFVPPRMFLLPLPSRLDDFFERRMRRFPAKHAL